MAAWVNRRIWPNAFVCLQKVHRLSKADRPVRSKINTYHPDRQPAPLQSLLDENVVKEWIKYVRLIRFKYQIPIFFPTLPHLISPYIWIILPISSLFPPLHVLHY